MLLIGATLIQNIGFCNSMYKHVLGPYFPRKKKKKPHEISYTDILLPSLHSSLFYVEGLDSNSSPSIAEDSGQNSGQNKHMGLEATVCEIESLAPDLIISVTYDTWNVILWTTFVLYER